MARKCRQQRRRRELNGDIIEEILLRIPPDEPVHLFRAAFVCKLWLRVASDPAFLQRYSAFHRAAPLLGFFCNFESSGSGSFADFIPAVASMPLEGHSTWVSWVPDCRHNRILLISGRPFQVWDPFSSSWDELEDSQYTSLFNRVVLCAVHGCDHRSCRSGPYHVVSVGVDKSDRSTVHARVYSSESRSWGSPASEQFEGAHYSYVDLKRPTLVGDGIYFTFNRGARILKYDLVKHRLSLIGVPYLYKNVPVLMQNEDGSLGIAGVKDSRLYLWSMKVDNEDGVTGWVKQRVIKLKKILPVEVISHQANVIGFAEGAEVFFISTNAGAFTLELKSGRVRKVGEPKDYLGATPFISFCTPHHGRCSKWTK